MDDATPPGPSGPPMRAGFSSIVLAGSSWLCPDGTIDQPDMSLIYGASVAARGTQAPGIDDVSHDETLA
jgi:hypothetical protein